MKRLLSLWEGFFSANEGGGHPMYIFMKQKEMINKGKIHVFVITISRTSIYRFQLVYINLSPIKNQFNPGQNEWISVIWVRFEVNDDCTRYQRTARDNVYFRLHFRLSKWIKFVQIWFWFGHIWMKPRRWWRILGLTSGCTSGITAGHSCASSVCCRYWLWW